MRIYIIIAFFMCTTFIISCTDDYQTYASQSNGTIITKSFDDILAEQTDYSIYISEEAERCLKLAENALKVSPSLALINYKFTLNKYREDRKYSSQSSRVERKSQSGITRSQLINEIIPDTKALAFKAASTDIFELMLFATRIGRDSTTYYSPDIIEIVYVMERSGQKEKANKIRNCIISSPDSNIRPELSRYKLMDYAQRDMKSGKQDRAIETMNAILERKNVDTSNLTGMPLSDMAKTYLDCGQFEKANQALMMIYNSKKSITENGTIDGVITKATREKQFDFAVDYAIGIQNQKNRFVLLNSIINQVHENGYYSEFEKYMDKIHQSLMEKATSGYSPTHRNKALMKLAVCYNNVDQTEKAAEIINKFFSMSNLGKPGYTGYLEKTHEVVDKVKTENENDGRNFSYYMTRGPLVDMVKTLCEIGQRERALKVIEEKWKFTSADNVSKYMLPNIYIQIIQSSLFMEDYTTAETVYSDFIGRTDEYEENKFSIFIMILNAANAFNEYGHSKFVESCLKDAYSYLKSNIPDGTIWSSYIRNVEKALCELADYPAAFDIAEFLDEKSSSNDKYTSRMAKHLYNTGNPEMALEKGYSLDSVAESDPLLRKQTSKAKSLIIDGMLDEALEIAGKMEGHNKYQYIYNIHLKIATEYARRGDIQKAIEMIEPVDRRWPRNEKHNIADVLMHYVDGKNPSRQEQQAIINIILPDIQQFDYVLSLVGTYQPGISDKSIIELAHKAEKDVLHCAHYITLSQWGSPSFTAELLTDYAAGLIELNMHDEARDALEKAYPLWFKHPEHDPSSNNLLDTALIWGKLGEREKAIAIIDDASNLKDEYGWNEDDILAIALAYRDIGAMQNAQDFIDNLDARDFNYMNNLETDMGNKLIKAQWLAENGKYEIAWDSLANVELGYNERIDYHSIPRMALKNGEYEIANTMAQQIEKTSSRLHLLNAIVIAMTENNVDFDVDSIFNKTLDELSKSKDDKTKAYSFAYIAKVYYDAGKHDKAREFANVALESANKILDDKHAAYTLKTVSEALIHCGMSDDADILKGKHTDNQHQYPYMKPDQAIIYAENGDFEKAIEFILNQECLYEPSVTMTSIARYMISAEEYDLAFDTLELGKDRTKIKMCPRQGCWGGGSNPYSDFPLLFLDAGRFDLAMKSLNFLGRDDATVTALMKIELEIRNQDYELTDEDRTALKRLIHSDPYYIN